ncbi:hypothetical protein FACS1894164_06990 [Spirochaetia bacterium]|nr:hypothetical protein FACS1894164_06990 [Spirochaetia bacterium]
MKKIFSLLAALTLVTGSVFAEFSWSGDAELSWSPISSDGTDLSSKWGLGNSRVRLSAAAKNEEGTFGVQTRINANKGGIAGEVTWGWWQPIKQFKLTIGQIDHREGVTIWNLDAQDKLGGSGYGGGGGDLFTGFGKAGALIELFPIDNLAIGINIGADGILWNRGTVVLIRTGANTAASPYVYTYDDGLLAPISAAATFTLPDLLDIRLGFFGDANNVEIGRPTAGPKAGTGDVPNTTSGATLQAAVNVTAIAGVQVLIGAKIPLGKLTFVDGTVAADGKFASIPLPAGFSGQNPYVTKDAFTSPLEIALGATYTADALSVNVHARVFLGGKLDLGTTGTVTPGTQIGFDLDLDYNLGALKAGLLFGIQSVGEDEGKIATYYNQESSFIWEAIPYVAKSFAGGNVYCGFKFGTNAAGDFLWSVPVGFGYGF